MSTDPSVYRRLEALERAAALRQDRVLTDSGTWTPAFAGTGTTGTFTYSAQQGVYQRVGTQVMALGFVSISAITVAPTGNMTITGLPLTAGATLSAYAVTLSDPILVMPAGGLAFAADVTASTAVIRLLYYLSSTLTAYPAASFTAALSRAAVCAVYEVA